MKLYHLLLPFLAINLSNCTHTPPAETPKEPSAQTPVDVHGKLSISGSELLDQKGQTVQLKGMSSHGLQWYPEFVSYDAMKWLRDDWQISVIRLAMYTGEGGYMDDPKVKTKVIDAIDSAIKLGLYVIVDWHILSEKDPNKLRKEAKEFFIEIASKCKNYPNILYEIANEPNDFVDKNGKRIENSVTRKKHIKPYAEELVKAIRSVDAENIIIIPTEDWDLEVDKAAEDPVQGKNLMYAVHFYAGGIDPKTGKTGHLQTGPEWLLGKIDAARKKGIAVFVTEWGTSGWTGNDGNDFCTARKWIKYLGENKISWANWSLTSKAETSAALKPTATGKGAWKASDLTVSGQFIRSAIRQQRADYTSLEFKQTCP